MISQAYLTPCAGMTCATHVDNCNTFPVLSIFKTNNKFITPQSFLSITSSKGTRWIVVTRYGPRTNFQRNWFRCTSVFTPIFVDIMPTYSFRTWIFPSAIISFSLLARRKYPRNIIYESSSRWKSSHVP